MLSGLTSAPEFRLIREMHYRNEFASVDCLQNTANRFFVDQQWRKTTGPAVSGRGAAMAASSSDQCHRCKEFGHFQRDCPMSAQPSRPTKGKKPGKKRGSGGSGKSKWCFLPRTKTHSDAECKAQQNNGNKRKQEELQRLAANLAVVQAAGPAHFSHLGSAHLAQPFQAAAPQASYAPSELTTFGFSFNALGASAAPAVLPAASASASSASSARDHHLPSEYFGAFMTSSAAESSLALFRSDESFILILVDSGATDNLLDPALTPGVRAHMRDIEDLRIPLPIIAAGQHVLHGVTTGGLFGTVADDSGHDRQVSFRVVLVPGLGTNLFSVTAALSNEVASLFYPENPRLESRDVVVQMKIRGVDDTGKITCSITVKLSAGDGGRQTLGEDPDGLALRVETASLCHRRMRHINSKSLDVLRKEAANGIDYTGDVQDCRACRLNKSSQQPRPKHAVYGVSRAFQIVFVDNLGPFTPTVLGGFKYAAKFVDNTPSGRSSSSLRIRLARLTPSSCSTRGPSSPAASASTCFVRIGEPSLRARPTDSTAWTSASGFNYHPRTPPRRSERMSVQAGRS